MKLRLVALLALLLASGLRAVEFDTGKSVEPERRDNPAAEAPAPLAFDAGDVPTGYPLLRHELRGEVRFYGGGGVLSKLTLGVFSRFVMGAALDVPNLVGGGDIQLTRERAQLLLRLNIFREDKVWPAISLGWDGPSYAGAEIRGLYLALSKELKTPLGYLQLHGGVSSPTPETFKGVQDGRAFAALTANWQQLLVFGELDELGSPQGGVGNAGLRYFFDPLSLGLEFRDLSGTRGSAVVERLLRVSYSGLF